MHNTEKKDAKFLLYLSIETKKNKTEKGNKIKYKKTSISLFSISINIPKTEITAKIIANAPDITA